MTSDRSKTSRSARTALALAASTGLALTVVAGGAQAAGAGEDKQPIDELGAVAALSAHKQAPAAENDAVVVPAAGASETESVATVTTAAPGPAEEEQRAAAEAAQREQEAATSTTQAAAGAETTSAAASASAASSTAVSVPAPSASGVVGIAMQYVGTPYVSGGTSPAGFDCSGFVQFVYAQARIALPRTSYAQGAAGTLVSAAEAQPGDIVYYGYHVGIYAGGGMMIDAGTGDTGVVYRQVWGSPEGYVRIG